MAFGAQDRPAVHQGALVTGRVLVHVFLVVLGEDILFDNPGGKLFIPRTVIVMAVIAVHFGGYRRHHLVGRQGGTVRIFNDDVRKLVRLADCRGAVAEFCQWDAHSLEMVPLQIHCTG